MPLRATGQCGIERVSSAACAHARGEVGVGGIERVGSFERRRGEILNYGVEELAEGLEESTYVSRLGLLPQRFDRASEVSVE